MSYFYKNVENKENKYIYSKILYDSNSFFLDFYMYRHLYYAINLINPRKCKYIIDLGCADGPLLPNVNQYGKFNIGIDLNLDYLEYARNLINYHEFPLLKTALINAEGKKLPIKNESIDTVICLEVFEHVPKVLNLINEIKRILKYDGELIYSLPIEIGFSLLFRDLIGRILSFPRDSYNLRELIRNGILKKPNTQRIYYPQTRIYSHKNFDYRILQNYIKNNFKILKKNFSPLPFLKTLNPHLICKVQKKRPN